MSEQKQFKTGVLGVGNMGQYHVNVLSSIDQVELVGVFDTDKKKAAEVAEKFGIKSFDHMDELLESVDAVTVAVPTNKHFETASRAIELGKHVLIEKPITKTLEEAEELIAMAKKNNIILQVGHVERFNGAVLELQKIVIDPLLIETRRLSPYTPRITDVGVVLDMLIHDLDIVINLIKSPLKSYSAMGSAVKGEHEDIATINLEFENGAVAVLIASRISQMKERKLYITQEKSFIKLNYTTQDIEIHRQATSAHLTTPEEIKYSQESFVENLYIHKDNPLKSEQLHFLDCIRNRSHPQVSNEQDLVTLKIALDSIAQIKGR